MSQRSSQSCRKLLFMKLFSSFSLVLKNPKSKIQVKLIDFISTRISLRSLQTSIEIKKDHESLGSEGTRLSHSEHLCFLIQTVFQISRHSGQMNRKKDVEFCLIC